MTSKLVSELSQVMMSVLEQHAVNAQRAKDGLSLANVVLLRCSFFLLVMLLVMIFVFKFRGCGGRIDVPSFETLHQMKPFCM